MDNPKLLILFHSDSFPQTSTTEGLEKTYVSNLESRKVFSKRYADTNNSLGDAYDRRMEALFREGHSGKRSEHQS